MDKSFRELFGAGAEKLRLDTQHFVAPSGKKFDLQTVASNYHVELSPGSVLIFFYPTHFVLL